MMAYLNKVLLIGRVGKDPEITVMQSGVKKVSFSLATSEKFKDKTTGELKESTQWHNVVGWRLIADIVERLQVKKGALLYAEGKATNRSYDSSDGTKKYISEIEMLSFQLLESKTQQQQARPQQQNDQSFGDHADDGDFDDMPF
jgi:single-strand DNA-binding protein